jgi:hypothetical protein
MTAKAFWERQDFHYLLTYSFNRGVKLAALLEHTKQALRTARFMQQPKLQRQLESLTRGNYLLTEGLSAVHSTATQIAQLSRDSVEAQRIASAFGSSTDPLFYSGCGPVYRDALAFYGPQYELLSVLNICFECQYMKTEAGILVEADDATYSLLRQLLEQLGHPINE